MHLVKFVKTACHKATGFVRGNLVSLSRAAMTLALVVVFSAVAMAEDAGVDISTGANAIQSVADGLKDYLPAVRVICYVIAALMGIPAAVGIVNKMNNQDQDVKKSIMLLIGGCIFLIACGTFIPMFFGY